MTFSNADKDAVRRILIIKTSALGDVVRTFPAIVFVRKTFPKAHISFLVGEPYVELLEPCPHIDEIIPYKKRRNTQDLLGFWRFTGELKRRRFDMVLNLQNTRRFDFVAKRTGAWLRTSIVTVERPNDGIEGVFEILRTAGLDPQRRYYEFWFSPEDNLFAEHFRMDNDLLPHHRLIGLNPGGGWTTKQWPLKHFAGLIDKIADAVDNTRFLIFGSAEERERGAEIASMTGALTVVAAGETTIRQAARLIRECAAFVSNDSGLMHVAAIQDVPTVGLFGPTSPAYHGPCREGNIALYRGVECAPCYSAECTLDLDPLFCINSISVEEVFRAVRRIMR